MTSVEGDETILLVEDEIAVLKFMRGALEREGYRIVEASTGREALDAWQSNQDICLSVTDLVLPVASDSGSRFASKNDSTPSA